MKIVFITGMISGLAAYQAFLIFSDQEIVQRDLLVQQQNLVAGLEQENRELTDELFRPRAPLYHMVDWPLPPLPL